MNLIDQLQKIAASKEELEVLQDFCVSVIDAYDETLKDYSEIIDKFKKLGTKSGILVNGQEINQDLFNKIMESRDEVIKENSASIDTLRGFLQKLNQFMEIFKENN